MGPAWLWEHCFVSIPLEECDEKFQIFQTIDSSSLKAFHQFKLGDPHKLRPRTFENLDPPLVRKVKKRGRPRPRADHPSPLVREIFFANERTRVETEWISLIEVSQLLTLETNSLSRFGEWPNSHTTEHRWTIQIPQNCSTTAALSRTPHNHKG